MKDENPELQLGKTILEALEDALANADWESSLFSSAIGKKLQEFRQEMQEAVEAKQQAIREADPNKKYIFAKQQTGQIVVFISLYNVDGNNIAKWEKLLAGLSRQAVSRPTYRKKSHVEELIRSKRAPINEAYVSLFINESDILQVNPEKIQRDSFGNELIVLKDNAIKLENIRYLKHISGKYVYQGYRLVRE